MRAVRSGPPVMFYTNKISDLSLKSGIPSFFARLLIVRASSFPATPVIRHCHSRRFVLRAADCGVAGEAVSPRTDRSVPGARRSHSWTPAPD
jgi:hypothetical protein